jgi:chloride channel 2
MRKIYIEQFLWLIGLSVVASATALFVDESVYAFNGYKLHYRDNYFYWMAASLFFAGCAQACIQYISPLAQGSGIPQMKAIMAGVNLPNMLSFKTYVSKVLGMVCMLSSGMSLGKEGPFVHIAGCIANSLPYKDLRSNKTLMHQFLTAAVAVGVTCTFGAPIGGVLFSIEVSSTSFTVANLWKSFFASTVTVLCFKSVGLLASAAVFSADASYFYSGVAAVGINHEMPFFAGLGIFCGILGTLYIQF